MTIQFAKQRGFSLIEVLITLVILAFGLLGLAGMQSVGLKNAQSSQQRSQATMLSYDIVDRMRSNCSAALSGAYNIGLTATAPTGSAMPATDVRNWRTTLSSALTAGTGSISVNAVNKVATVTVQWNDSRATGGASSHQVEFSGVLPSLATCQGT